MHRFFLILSFLSVLQAFTQPSVSPNSSDILLGLQKLNTVGSVLYIAAHPDDENTRLLAYLAREKKLRTAYLSLTRGDGGQNLIGKEQGDALGLIRTQELLAARRTDGAEQLFTRANDFGYSKNPEETFSIWGKDSILSDVVWAIRKFKPDVIICRFPTTGEGGHGHHTASAILALEAFDAAADPTKFPEQLKYVQVWKTRRIFWNTFNFGGTNTTSPDQLKTDVGVYNTLLGRGYGEIASESRSMHKSQGFGSAKTRGSTIEYFKLLKGDTVKNDLFEKIDQSWKRFPQTAKLNSMIENCIKKFNPLKPEEIVKDLTAIYQQISALDEKNPDVLYWKNHKLKETSDLILSCCGLWMECYNSEVTAVPGKTLSLSAQIVKRLNADVKLKSVVYSESNDTLTNLQLKNNELYTFKRMIALPETSPYSNPYWLNEKHEQNRFVVNQRALIGQPENSAAARVIFNLEVGGLSLKIERPVVYKFTDPVKGEIYRPVEFLPPATVNISERIIMVSDASPKVIQIVVKANFPNTKGKIEIVAPDGWKTTMNDEQFALSAKGDEAVFAVTVTPSSNSNGVLKAMINIDGKKNNKSIRRIEYDHIPYQFILSDAEVKFSSVDLKRTQGKVAYIAGAGDDVAACLKQVGYNIVVLTDEQLTNENLSQYQSIITGVRAYNTTERLQVHYNKLMDYVKNGGNLIVQYNTNNRIGPVLAKIGPYPFTISRDRVTDEKAEVRILKPEHPVFNIPNKISAADFEGWIQERGIYFVSEKDKNYETLLSMNDPGEKASEGSLIVTKYGKGNFVYTGLAFFRELPAGVPGAYRLLINLLSLPQNQ